jgi:hypothetical protein
VRQRDVGRWIVGAVAAAAWFALAAAGAGAQIAVSGGLDAEFVCAPGDILEGTISVSNSSDAAVDVTMTQVDYLFFFDGSNSYAEPGSTPRSNAPWIALPAGERVTVPAQSIAVVSYRVTIPNDPALVGTYWSMILIKPVDSSPAPEAAADQVGMRVVVQYGFQIVTTIDDTGERSLEIVGHSLLRTDEGVVLQMDVENNGERWLRPDVWLELYDALGTLVGRYDGTRMRIYPGCSIRQRLVIGSIASGPYQGLVFFDNGDDFVRAARYTLNF